MVVEGSCSSFAGGDERGVVGVEGRGGGGSQGGDGDGGDSGGAFASRVAPSSFVGSDNYGRDRLSRPLGLPLGAFSGLKVCEVAIFLLRKEGGRRAGRER